MDPLPDDAPLVGTDEVDEFEVITIDDDDDDEVTTTVVDKTTEENNKAPIKTSLMTCYRCPSRATGTFKCRKAFLYHIKRHKFGSIFSCPTCTKSFVTINLCFAHENFVHKSNHASSLLQTAYGHVKKQDTLNNNKTDNNEDWQSNSNYFDNRILGSTTLRTYKGPPVNNMLESYEIQLYHSNPKSYRANCISGIAIRKHEENIEKNFHDKNWLGRFSTTKKVYDGKQPTTTQKRIKAKASSSNSITNGIYQKQLPSSSSSSSTSFFRPVSSSQLDQQRKKSPSPPISLSSEDSSDDSSDEDYIPNTDNDRNPFFKTKRSGWGKKKKSAKERKQKGLLHTNPNRTKKRASSVPPLLPDSSYTVKENFLYSLGLYNTLRFQLHRKVPPNDLKLRKCSVNLKRLNKFDMISYKYQ